mmetsp:Transcript_23576/g.23770  ORF Transcript_23576/g.23770 Transcript_23576/m.23770 type:complete len:294 (-) Transcript_23576:80-961(-)
MPSALLNMRRVSLYRSIKLLYPTPNALPSTSCRCFSNSGSITLVNSSLNFNLSRSKHRHNLVSHNSTGLDLKSGIFSRSMFIQTTPTPNEDAVKFMPGREVMPDNGSKEFTSLQSASQSPLARRLLTVAGVKAVFFGPDFITVVRVSDVDWQVLKPEIFGAITEAFASGEPVLDQDAEVISDTTILPEDDDVVAMIKELLEQRIKPAVAEDGGNIIFRGFEPESGTVKVELQGACSSCSSSSVTLKMGVQNMLMHYVPEVKQVEEVKSEAEQQSEAAFSSLEKRLSDSGILRS